MLQRFWNNRPGGLLACVALLSKAIFRKISCKIRSLIISNNLGSCGSNLIIYKNFTYRHPFRIHVGNNVFFDNDVSLSTDNGESNIFIGDNVSIAQDVFIDFTGGVVICNNAHIAFGVYITTHTHGYDPSAAPIGKPLEICEHVFIGARSSILYNCNKIGKYAVIGVGAIVTKDVPDYAIVAGNPAKIIGYVKEGIN